MKNRFVACYSGSVVALALIALMVGHLPGGASSYLFVRFHSAIEAVGGAAALLLSSLLSIKSKGSGRPYFPLIQCALNAMGVLDVFHSIAPGGNNFVWLHSAATLSGGLFLSLVWVPERVLKIQAVRALPVFVLVVATVSGIGALVFPEAVPVMVVRKEFTPAAQGLNVLGGILFLVAGVWFVKKHREHGRRLDEVIFASFCLLFGLAGILFDFSQLWDAEWWVWHFLRLFAYTLALLFVFYTFRLGEESLRESEERYRRLVDNSPDLVYIFSTRTGGVFYSGKVKEILGYSAEELARSPYIWRDSIHPDDLAGVDAAVHAPPQGKPVNVEYRIRDRRGQWHWFLDRFTVSPGNGDEILLEGLASDITERKRVEESLAETAARFQSIFNSISDAIVMTDTERRVVSVNPAFQNQWGYTEDELRGETTACLYADPKDYENLGQSRYTPHAVTQANVYEMRYRRKDGTLFWGETRGARVTDDQGRVLGLIGIHRDITARKQAENALLESESRYRDLVDNMPVGVFTSDIAGHIQFVNEALVDILGYGHREDLLQKNATELYAEADGRRSLVEHLKRTGKVANHETRLTTQDGRVRDVLMGAVLKGERLSGTVTDITDRKRAEREIARLSSRNEAILSAIPDIIMEVDANKIYTWANKAGHEFFGEDVIGREAAFYFEGEQETYGRVQPLFEGDENVVYVESWQRRKDGEIRLLGWWCRVLKDKQGVVTGALSTARDITDARRLELAVQESEVRFRTLFEQAAVGVAQIDSRTGTFVRTNRRYCDIVGYSPAEMEHLSFQKITHPEDLPQDLENMNLLVQGRIREFSVEKRYIRRDGSLVWVNLSVSPMWALGERPEYHIAVVEDITDRKLAEIRLQEYADKQAVLLREVNHRVKNNLAAIMSMIHKEEDRTGQAGAVPHVPFLHELEGRIRGLLTVHTMLSASHWQPLRLRDLCERIAENALRSAPQGFDVRITGADILVNSDQAHHLTLVLNELVTNSMKYGASESPPPLIDISVKESGPGISMVFRDNGPGFPAEMLRPDYQPATMGMGLLMGIVRKSLRGTITFRNDGGAATEITFDSRSAPQEVAYE